MASYLKTLHSVSLHNSIGGLFIRAEIKKVFCKELLTQIAQSPSVKIHIQWLHVCQSRALRGPFSLLRLIWENGSKLAAKLERSCFHTEEPCESLSLYPPLSDLPNNNKPSVTWNSWDAIPLPLASSSLDKKTNTPKKLYNI